MNVPDFILNPVHPVKIALIGCGGTGSHVAVELAKVHCSLLALNHPGIELTVFDDDVVEEHNCGRQLFSFSDVGRKKGDVIVERINMYYGLNWKSVVQRFNGEESGFEVLIGAVDNLGSRRIIRENFHSYNSYGGNEGVWLDFGNDMDRGQVVLGMICGNDKVLKDFFDHFPDELDRKEKGDMPSCSVFDSLQKQDLFINSILAKFGVDLLYKLLRYAHLDFQGGFINLSNFSTVGIPVEQIKEAV